MPVRASDSVTLAVLPAPSYVRTYYLLQASTLAAPAVPTTNPPPSPWTTTEPSYTAGSTQTLYTVMLTAYGAVAFEYGPVQKSSSYEAAKAAYNLAYNTGQALDGLAKILVGTAVPTTNAPAAPNGSVYNRHQTNLSGPVIASYARVNGAWVETPTIVRAGQVEAGALDGITVTGATLRTASSGQRLQLDINGLRALNASGQEVARLQASDGGMSVGGGLVVRESSDPLQNFVELVPGSTVSSKEEAATSAYAQSRTVKRIENAGYEVFSVRSTPVSGNPDSASVAIAVERPSSTLNTPRSASLLTYGADLLVGASGPGSQQWNRDLKLYGRNVYINDGLIDGSFYDWFFLTPASGWSGATGATTRPRVRRIGRFVEYRGSLFGGTGGTTATTLPSWACPDATIQPPVRGIGAGVTDRFTTARIWAAGSFQPGSNLDGESVCIWTAA